MPPPRSSIPSRSGNGSRPRSARPIACWSCVARARPWPPAPAGNGRDWLASQCRGQGGRVDWCVAYRRRAPAWSAAQRELARSASQDGTVWLLSSSEALDNLSALLPGIDWSRARALATHPRIAQSAARLGFGLVRTSRPALDDMLLHLESMA